MQKTKITKSKITGITAAKEKDAVIPVIVNVKTADYIPNWLKPRKKITSYIFTSDVKQHDLKKLEVDNQVTSVAVNQALHMVK